MNLIIKPTNSCTQRFNSTTHFKRTKPHYTKFQKPHGKQVLNSVQTQAKTLPEEIFEMFYGTEQLRGSRSAKELEGGELVKAITSLIHHFANSVEGIEQLSFGEMKDIEIPPDLFSEAEVAKDSLIELHKLLIKYEFNVRSLETDTQELLKKYELLPRE